MLLVRTPTVALVGNPNTGKTTLFNALAGMRQHVGNYPGVTVETKKGKCRVGAMTFDVIDLPGTYSLAPRSPDEMVAVEVILGRQTGESRPDVVVAIVDAANLERNLYLVTQVMELGVPVVIALNMMDVARHQGVTLDVAKLARNLGVPVVPMQANKSMGIEELKQAVAATLDQPAPSAGPIFPAAFEREVTALGPVVGTNVPSYLVRRLLLDVGGYTEEFLGNGHAERLKTEVRAARQRLHEAGCPVPAIEARTRYAWIRESTHACVTRPAHRPVGWTDRLDRILTHKVWGLAIFMGLMFLLFQSIFTWAKPFMDLISSGQEWLGDVVRDGLDPGPLRSLLADGVIKGVGSVLVFLPQIMILFGFIAILEDCGYMARAAFLMDRLMKFCGLNGKSFIPLLSSMACAVPGIMAARVIENRRDRLATILVAPLMSCSARLPVYTLLIGAFLSRDFAWWVPGLTLFGLYALGLIVAPLVALCLKSTLLRGATPAFVMEMPLYKIPALRLVVRRACDSGWMFIRRAGTFILATMIVVWTLLYFPTSDPNNPNKTFEQQIEEKEEAKVGPEQQTVRDLRKQKAELEAADGDEDKIKALKDLLDPVDEEINELKSKWVSQSYLGSLGRLIEPAVEPLGWDWRIGMAALASFPAREVMVGTLGLIYSEGKVDTEDIRSAGVSGETELGKRLQKESIFTVPVALSVLVFFALCCQCASTLAVIRRETNSWRWPAFTFVYMTALAYVAALAVFQIGRLFI
jgi:ferrous iron transport protein B